LYEVTSITEMDWVMGVDGGEQRYRGNVDEMSHREYILGRPWGS